MDTTIDTLFKKGYSKTQIAKILEIDRKTVRKVLKELYEAGKNVLEIILVLPMSLIT